MPQVGRRHARTAHRTRQSRYYGSAPSTAGLVNEASGGQSTHSTSRFRHRSATGPLHVTTAPTRQPRFHRLETSRGIGVPPRPERLGGEYGTLLRAQKPTRARGRWHVLRVVSHTKRRRGGVVRRRGVSGAKTRGWRRDTPGKVLEDRRSPRDRGRMGTSVRWNAPKSGARLAARLQSSSARASFASACTASCLSAIARGSVSGARSHRRRSLFPAGVAQSSTRSSKLPRLVPSAP